MMLKGVFYFSTDGHFVQQGIMRNISVKLFLMWASVSGDV